MPRLKVNKKIRKSFEKNVHEYLYTELYDLVNQTVLLYIGNDIDMDAIRELNNELESELKDV